MNPPKMPIHIGDLLRDTSHLGADEFGGYLLLMFHHWSTGSLPEDDKRLSTIARMSAAQWKRARPELEKFFQPGWKHGRIEKDLATSHANYEKRAKAGAEGGKAKAAAKQSASKTLAMLEPESGNALATDNPLPKKDAAPAALRVVPEMPPMTAADLEKSYFDRGKIVLGSSAGGILKNLLKAKENNVALARAAIEQASVKSDPREYIGAVIRGPKSSNEPNWLDGIPGVL